MPRHVPLPVQLGTDPFTIHEGSAAGLSEKRMRGSDLAAPFPAVRMSATIQLDLRTTCRAYSGRLRPGEVFSHVTAARLWGIPVDDEWAESEPLHVSIPAPGRAARGRGVHGHRLARAGRQRVTVAGLPTIDPVSVWLQLAESLSFPGLVAAGDYLVRRPPRSEDPRRPFCDREHLVQRADSTSGRGAASARKAAALVREGSDSPQESRLRLALVGSGLPEPELNPELRSASGRFVARVDMLYRTERVIVEYDGDQHRTDRRQYDRDIRRIDALHDLGWTVIRIRSPQMRHDATEATALVRRALSRHGSIEFPLSAL
ncbi:DUF559 domain-containing protein [Herbiconiux sp. CPCC 205716]|uniref:DUF559 domain-containing protein n=1 Tax=Herbiconiux gentiana TaxID=2970912 RepID=A0ABT2GDY5_9MICO|nr:DUF559 domain-containing protein [Herbiconiux gentiana]MCS5714433.1 DUF559 domain-containing protein [Herbiconiux gentiana]